MKRIGIYPGSFDPLHDGHVAFASGALEIGGLDEVLFLPERSPRNKPNVTPIDVRFRNLQQRISPQAAFTTILMADQRFTVRETLPELQRRFPDTRLSLLIGSDVLRTLHTWPDLPVLFASVDIVIGLRGEDTIADAASSMRAIQQQVGFEVGYHCVATSHHHLSSTLLRVNGHKLVV